MPKKVFAPGNRWLVAYLAFLSAFAPLSTDMYLPALPHMTQALQTTDALSSLSISCFLLLFGASMLFWGPLSDKYGRKPVLYTGALLYVVSSLFLALAQSIWPLLFWRAVQAIGSGGISAMALAIVKDVLRGRAMEKVITWIQTITILAPMLAPVIGGALLAVTDWRGIFACLLLCGLLAGAGTLLLRETMHHPVQGNAFRTLGRLLVVLRHRGFRCLLLLFSATHRSNGHLFRFVLRFFYAERNPVQIKKEPYGSFLIFISDNRLLTVGTYRDNLHRYSQLLF